MRTKYPVHYSGVFTNNELDKIVDMEDNLEFTDGLVGKDDKNVYNPDKRITRIAWVHPNNKTIWLFTKSAQAFCGSPISQLQSMQYSVYYVKGHYKWHRDIGHQDNVANERIVTGVLQLIDPEAYTGGILQVDTGSEIVEVEKERGMLSVFPAGWRHKVTPVKSGVRKTLIMWGLK